MAWAYILSYKVVILSKDEEENSRLNKTQDDPYQRESFKQSPFTVWLIKRKRVFITVMRNAWIPQPWERRASPLNF